MALQIFHLPILSKKKESISEYRLEELKSGPFKASCLNVKLGQTGFLASTEAQYALPLFVQAMLHVLMRHVQTVLPNKPAFNFFNCKRKFKISHDVGN